MSPHSNSAHWSYMNIPSEYEDRFRSKLVSKTLSILKLDRKAKRLCLISGALLLFGLFELLLSMIFNNYTLFAVSFHTIHNAITLLISFFTLVASKMKSSKRYTYGYERLEIVASFSNSSFISFTGLFILFECVEGIIEHHPSWGSFYTFLLSFIGIAVHAYTTHRFNEHLKMRTETITELDDTNVTRINTTHYLSLMLSSFFILIGFTTGDKIIAIIRTISMMNRSIRHCFSTGRILLQSVPLKIKDILESSLNQILNIDGVEEIVSDRIHFWTHSPGVYIGTLVIRVHPNADEQFILAQAQQHLSPFIQHLTIQIEKTENIQEHPQEFQQPDINYMYTSDTITTYQESENYYE